MSDIPFGLGAKERPSDIRDYHLGTAQAPVAIPTVFMPDYSAIPVKMQGKYGTCGGHAGAMMESMFEGIDLSPKFLWKEIKQIDGYPLDAGTDSKSVLKTLQKTGVCLEKLLPDTLDDTIEQYSDISSVTNEMLDNASPHGVISYAFIDNPSWDEMRQAIYQNKAVLARLDCGDGWWTPTWQEKDVLPLRLGNQISHHFVVLWGYDEKYIYFRNSWSAQWGRTGDGYFDSSYVPHVLEITTAIDGISLRQRTINLLTALVGALTKLVALLKSK